MNALSADELMEWVERTSFGWDDLLRRNPEVLDLPCSVRETTTVRGLIQHIVAVELRYAERLAGLPETSYDAISIDPDAMFATHARAMTLLRATLAREDTRWEEAIEFATRSAGTMRASRRVILVHALMHSVRHYAQLATLVRQHGIRPGWAMDYLFMGASNVEPLPVL